MTPLPALLQGFFTDRLLRQRQASGHTVAAYRDTFRLMLAFAAETFGQAPSDLSLEDLDAPFIGEFLDHLQKRRGNSARTRNARLAAIRSFYGYVALTEPACSLICQRVLAIPNMRHEKRPIEFLSRTEIDAVLAAPDLSTWTGRRDRVLLLLAIQTGLRVSEIIGLRCEHVVLGSGAHVRCTGKGRKQRSTPLRKDVARSLRAWMIEECRGRDDDHLFLSTRRGPLSRDAIEHLVAKHVEVASRSCLTLRRKRITPHVLRHTAAMELLQSGVDRSVIALWLGHESLETTQIYLHADMAMKEKAMERTTPSKAKIVRYRPDDDLMAFLTSL
jgi:site-specific recombinase XerD